MRMSWNRVNRTMTTLVVLGVAANAYAGTSTWTGNAADGLFGTADNWDPAGVPGAVEADDVNINNGATVQINEGDAFNPAGRFNLGQSAGDSGELEINGGSLTVDRMLVGNEGFGRIVQNGGEVITVGSNHVRIGGHNDGGDPNTGTGEWYLHGGRIESEVFTIGRTGPNGLFEMTDGEVTTSWLVLGKRDNSHGTFNMSGGFIQVNNDFEIGDGGSGTFTMSGGHIRGANQMAVSHRAGTATADISGGIIDMTLDGVDTGIWVGRNRDSEASNSDKASGTLRVIGGDTQLWASNFVMDQSADEDDTVSAKLISHLTGTDYTTIRARRNVDIEFGDFAVELGGGFAPNVGMEFIIARANDAIDDIEGAIQPQVTGTADGLVLFDEETIFQSVDYSAAALRSGLSWELEIRNDEFDFPVEVVLKVVGDFILGDMNGDGTFDAFDVAPFELALADKAAFASQFPNVDPDIRGDFDGFGGLDAFDVSQFEQALAGNPGGTPVPEPASLGLVALGLAAMARRRRGA